MARTLIEDHPGLARVFGSPHPLRTLAFVLPIIAAAAWLGRSAAGSAPLLLALGVAWWTFVEYALHRWLYHWRPKARWLRRVVESAHVYHHKNPADRAVWNAGPLLALPLAVALYLPLWALLGDTARPALALAGTTAAYFVYEWFHYLCHARRHERGWLARMQRFHLHHHERNGRANFGVTNPLWDVVFGTCDGKH
jgi:sterol desaturase/sphingolipid hydroxylase (fatty acid hydroxylase superfamily)